jgi:hypothetical protein
MVGASGPGGIEPAGRTAVHSRLPTGSQIAHRGYACSRTATSARTQLSAARAERSPLDLITMDLQDRLISLFVVGPDGRRPCFGWADRLLHDPTWKNNLLFNEYFHG